MFYVDGLWDRLRCSLGWHDWAERDLDGSPQTPVRACQRLHCTAIVWL